MWLIGLSKDSYVCVFTDVSMWSEVQLIRTESSAVVASPTATLVMYLNDMEIWTLG